MEHGLDNSLSNVQVSDYMKNGVVSPIMANFPDGPITEANNGNTIIEPVKLNGEGTQDNPFEDSYSSESDALVIDESIPKKKIRGKYNKRFKENVKWVNETENNELTNVNDSRSRLISEENSHSEVVKDIFTRTTNVVTVHPDEVQISSNIFNENTETSDNFSASSDVPEQTVNETFTHCDVPKLDSDISNNPEVVSHSNPFFHESIFELSQLHHANIEKLCSDVQHSTDILSSGKKTFKRAKPKPKLKEYAQYLGLQPAIQFKCPKCGKAGFESLLSLQEHFLQCNAVQLVEKSFENENVSGFKLTRKVFLCSACGTYYENWNLYMHMLECHKRYICLYCLGMFSVLDDLCQHIQSRHNFEPGIKNTLEDFYNTYNEPCYVVCCECNQQFSEGDDFFYHKCLPSKAITKSKSKYIKQIIAPENHITGDFGTESDEIIESSICNRQTFLDEQKHDMEKPYTKGDVINNLEEQSKDLTQIPKNIPESDLVKNQGNNVKQNYDDREVSKKNDNDNSQSKVVPGDISGKILDLQDYTGIDDLQKCKIIENVDRNINYDDQGTCEQDSLDSSKFSENSRDGNQQIGSIMDDTEGNLSDPGGNENVEDVPSSDPVETRKVPILSLKLPKPGAYPEPDFEDSDDSDKLDTGIDNIESENENHTVSELGEDLEHEEQHETPQQDSASKENKPTVSQYPVADSDIPVIEIELDQPMDKMDIKILLQKCLRATVSTCIYCNHSRRIAVNGKQLALHAIAEHRYSAINKSITEEELIPESFNIRIKECLAQLETVFFSLNSGASDEAVTFSHIFECFQCHYSTTIHKELYLHNRKFHSKNLLLCIMCKSNFYSYSELICHLCPGVYVLDYDVHFRCCMCVSDDLPSSFRLMVHLRKRHNVCDVCLEMCHSQYKLSNHVWKHKLHHFCYRCGIAYRNKPDITRHLFWKHGTESVLCKKCLQKKWPHVYHFCVPPTSFVCEECNLVFTKAVYLKVHKRLHTDEKKYTCTWEDCNETFISKKIMLKHLKIHTDPPEEINLDEDITDKVEKKEEESPEENIEKEVIKEMVESPKPVKPKVDVYDLPELNLSESDSSDTESEPEKAKMEENSNSPQSLEHQAEKLKDVLTLSDGTLGNQASSGSTSEQLPDLPEAPPEDDASSSVMQDIWDNFKNYQANKEKMDNMFIGEVDTKSDQPYVPDIPIPEVEEGITWQLALRDHDYCTDPVKIQAQDTIIEVKPSLESTESMDHDYCFHTEKDEEKSAKPVKAVPPPPDFLIQEEVKNSPSRKRTSSSSSSTSDTNSSCACGSSCSCSDSSSGSSSSSSDSSNSDSSTEEGRKRQQQRRLKRKERNKPPKKTQPLQAESEGKVDVVTSDQPPVVVEMTIRESDLETTESETDEEFYDKEPQKFARKILEEKRAQLLAEMGPNMVPNGSFIESTSRPPTPPAGTLEEEEDHPKRKKKTKKRKKRKSEKKLPVEERTYSATLIMDTEPVAPPPSVPYYQQFHNMRSQSPVVAPITLSMARNSPVRTPQTPPLFTPSADTPTMTRQESAMSDTSIRASKRRRVPNKFYGYSSDEEADKPQSLKKSKIEINRTIPAPPSPMLVPPITIKTVSSPITASPRPPTVEPITLRLPKPQNQPIDYKIHRRPPIPPIRLSAPRPQLPLPKEDSATESNDSDLDEPLPQLPQIVTEPAKPPQAQLYCYCRCPYDEVSEMIGCDSNDCQIEWFHFECVGIMVPPKGQWFCPDCRKKKQQQRSLN